MVDCMIVSVARRHTVTLLVHDADLSRVAQVVGVDMDAASLSVN